MSDKTTEIIALPIEGFALLISSCAQALINEVRKTWEDVDTKFLHENVGFLDEFVSKFEALHHKEKERTAP